MAQKHRLVRIAFMVIGLIFAASFAPASAEARGQCGGKASSWQGYYNNLQSYGAVSQAARVNRSAGYSPRDGSYKQWLKERVIVTKLYRATSITNYGCNANGLFGAGSKHLSKGWPVLVALPNKYSKSDIRLKRPRGKARKHYKAKVLKVKLVGQASCSNPGKATVFIKVYVKKTKSKKKKRKPPKKKPGNNQSIDQNVDGQGNCNSVNSGNISGPGSVQGSCNNVNVICNGEGSCSPTNTQNNTTYQTCVNNGGSWNSETNVCTYEQSPPPPPTPTSAECTDLAVAVNPQVNRGVFADVSYRAENATLTSTVFNWGDGTSTTVNGTHGEHVYAQAGTYTISATLTFSTPNGNRTATCMERTVTTKDGTQTPPPPEEAPGPNPEPSPDDPAPGGHQCYDEETGQPVEPRTDGTCPPGSYGAS